MMQQILEDALLRKGADKFGIYQLKLDDSTHRHRFASLESLRSEGLAVHRKNYRLVYVAELIPGTTPDSIFARFNIEHPHDFFGHSLSISDVIVLQKNGQISAYYVDSSFGGEPFALLPDFISANSIRRPIGVFMRGIPNGSGNAVPGFILDNGTVLLDEQRDEFGKFYTNGIGKNGKPTGLCYYPFYLGNTLMGFSEMQQIPEDA